MISMKLGKKELILLLACLSLSALLNAQSPPPQDSLVIYPHHGKNGIAYALPGLEEMPSPDYQVFVRGRAGILKPVFTYWAQQHKPGEPDEKEYESFAGFDCKGEVEVTVKLMGGAPSLTEKNVVIRPLKARVIPRIEPKARTIIFKINPDLDPKQKMLSVEIDGIRRPLYIFANPWQEAIPDTGSPEVHVFEPASGEDDIITQSNLDEITKTQTTLFFKPGIHNIDHFQLEKNGLTFYLAGGSVLRFRKKGLSGGPGTVIQLKSPGLKFMGRGIIDTKRDTEALEKHRCAGNILEINNSDRVKVEGIIIRHPLGFDVVAAACTNVEVSHVKLLGSQELVSNDGILMDGTKDALIEHCFANNHDDSLEVKAHYYVKSSTERVTFKDNVVWCRGGMSLGVTWENWWDISNITWIDNTILHHECYGNGDLCVYVGNRGTVSDIRFENIDIEDTQFAGICVLAEEHPWSFWKDPRVKEFIPDVDLSGDPQINWPFFKNIVFKNITIRYNPVYNSAYFPDPDTHGLGGWGCKLSIPVPEFEFGHRKPLRSHDLGGIVFDNVKILDYTDGADFPRYGNGQDHKAGALIKEHYLSDLTTDNWILWEGANRTESHSPEPDKIGKKERIQFWENRVKFITPKR
jgi:hypothetical protein